MDPKTRYLNCSNLESIHDKSLSTFYQLTQYYKASFALVVSVQDISYSNSLVMHYNVFQVNILTRPSPNNIKVHTHSKVYTYVLTC